MKINYNDRTFRPVNNSEAGEAGADTLFRYYQDGSVVWADYSGGEIICGQLIALCDHEGRLDMRYQHINVRGELMTGVCKSMPEALPDGRIKLHEEWRWTSGDGSTGTSVVEEISDESPGASMNSLTG